MKSVPSNDVSTKVWLVTGCSTGFGRHLIPAILARGDRVIATARQLLDLEYVKSMENAAERVLAIQLDVTQPYLQLCDKVQAAIKHFGGIDVLVNNAGLVVSGVWEEVSEEETSRQFEVNLFGALKMTRCVLPYMRKASQGVILFMGSIAGWHGVEAGGPYSASKFAVEGAAECLAKETSHLGIRTHILVLGQFRTNILNQNTKTESLIRSSIPDYDELRTKSLKRRADTHNKQRGNPMLAAQRIVDLVRLENMPEEHKGQLPLRIPLGTDALEVMKMKCTETLESLKGWDSFARSTDFTDFSTPVPSYLR